MPLCFRIRGPAAAAAKASAAAGGKVVKIHIHSSSKRKSSQNMPKIIKKSSFSMGFRSYVRHFRGAIWGLLRPSLPLCFPIRGPAAAAAKASAAAGGKGSQNFPIHSSSKRKSSQNMPKIIIFYGFQKLR